VELQREIAYHESAHAIATAGILGPEKVLGIMVRTEIGGNFHGDGGHVVSLFVPSHENAATLRGRMAVFFAGRAMDIIMHGVPMASAGSDIANANTTAWQLVVTSGVLAEETGSFMILGGPEQASPKLRARVAKELATADALAKAFVKANEGLIRSLAEQVMAQEPKEGSRMLAPGQFQALLQDKKIEFPTKPARRQ
jgi:ATP-dependent Zn protease